MANTESVVEEKHCHHCSFMNTLGVFHHKVCHCGHHHSDHNSSGGCRTKDCSCDRYDQSKKRSLEAIPSDKAKELSAEIGIDLEKLADQILAKNELAEAQARVDNLRERKNKLTTPR